MPKKYSDASLTTIVSCKNNLLQELCDEGVEFTKFDIDRYIRVEYQGTRLKISHDMNGTPKYINRIMFGYEGRDMICVVFYRDVTRFTIAL